MLRQQRKSLAPEVAQIAQHLTEQRRQLRRILRHVRIQRCRSAAGGQYGYEGAVGGGVETIAGDDGDEEGGGG